MELTVISLDVFASGTLLPSLLSQITKLTPLGLTPEAL